MSPQTRGPHKKSHGGLELEAWTDNSLHSASVGSNTALGMVYPTLEVYSRAVSSVGVMYHSSGPNTGSNPGGGRKKKAFITFFCF